MKNNKLSISDLLRMVNDLKDKRVLAKKELESNLKKLIKILGPVVAGDNVPSLDWSESAYKAAAKLDESRRKLRSLDHLIVVARRSCENR